jgi:hypothetical protein
MVKLAALQLRQMAPTSTASLGLGFGDRFEAFRGGSGSFEEGVPLAEKPTELQGKRSAERRCWLASPEPTASMAGGGRRFESVRGLEIPANQHLPLPV